LVERIHGKDEVSGSTPDRGSNSDFSRKLSLERAIFSLAKRNANQRKSGAVLPQFPKKIWLWNDSTPSLEPTLAKNQQIRADMKWKKEHNSETSPAEISFFS
jgi:hypothetical protein